MSKETEVNLETMPLDELKKLALAEADKDATPAAEPVAPPVRDAAGKFVAAPKDSDEVLDNSAEVVEDEPEEFIVRREIDLGDGSGVQVFSGRGATELDAVKDLNEKLFEAQRNASRTIRELQKKAPKVETPVEKTFSPDEEYVFKQLGEKPSEQFKTLFKEVTGMDVAEFKTSQAAIKEFQKNQRSLQVQQDFVNTHPDYIGNEKNGVAIRDWVQEHNYAEFDANNLEKAYQDLKKRGILELKPDEASVTTEEERLEAERIAQAQRESTQSRSPKKSSTVSPRGGRAPVVKTEPSEDELYKMPLDQLRKLSNDQLAKAGQE